MKNIDAYKVDLHIHTPASSDYKGPKEDDEYIDIVKQANASNVELMCIADHNTVKGYENIMILKKQSFSLLSSLHKRNDADPSFIKKVESEYEQFNSVHILMGVELSVSPGIHYVLVFKEDVEIHEVRSFLIELIKDESIVETGSPDFMLDINSRQLFEIVDKRFNESCFIYAPHCDSQSGVIESLKNLGTERINILKDRRLLCLGFNKDKSKSYIQNNLIPSVMGDRNTGINFIQDSDYHGRVGEQVGSQYFLLERSKGKVCYDVLLDRLKSKEYIKTSLDTAMESYDQFKCENIIFGFGNISATMQEQSTIDKLCATVCAILNSNKGSIEFEIEINNIDMEVAINSNIESFVNTITKNMDSGPEQIKYTHFQVSKSKQIIVISFKEYSRLCLYKGACYIVDSNNEVSIASACMVESIVARRIHDKFGVANEKLIEIITASSKLMKNSLISISNAYRTEPLMTNYKNYSAQYIKPITLSNEIKEIVENGDNGSSNGKISIIRYSEKIKCGRLVDSYLRFSAPIYDISNDLVNDIGIIIEKESIIITPGGATHLIAADTRLINSLPCYILDINGDETETRAFFAYLKSTFLHWLLCKVLGYDDLFDYMQTIKVNEIPIIRNLDSSFEYLSNKTNEVLSKEAAFFINIQCLGTDESIDIIEEMNVIINEHNYTCNEVLGDIDETIFDNLDDNREMINEILTDIRNIGMYDCNTIVKI